GTTIGHERRHNPLLQTDDEDAFVAGLLGGLGSYPPYFLRLREVNRAGPRLYGPARPALAGLSVGEARRALHAGAELVDVRPIEGFAAGHVPGSLSIPLRDQFAVWLGWLLPPERPLVFVCAADTDRAELVRQCRKIGYEQVLGELAGGLTAWQAAGWPVARMALVGPGEVGDDRRVLDVRQDSEWAAGHIPGAAHVELGALARQAGALGGAPLLVHCGHGPRAMTAASLLRRAGHADLQVLAGGPEEWSQATGRSLERA
ncbi:MAG TPA: rhodanese-like domain-containing protein, partial [Egibacteraceae bacterium]|nr:rhodanese-like domain-containing protein [Egibacteraceae bacterium]